MLISNSALVVRFHDLDPLGVVAATYRLSAIVSRHEGRIGHQQNSYRPLPPEASPAGILNAESASDW